MPESIKLTTSDGETVIVNPEKILMIHTLVQFESSSDLLVEETPEQIRKLIEQSLNNKY